jgi:hypothetical protein
MHASRVALAVAVVSLVGVLQNATGTFPPVPCQCRMPGCLFEAFYNCMVTP